MKKIILVVNVLLLILVLFLSLVAAALWVSYHELQTIVTNINVSAQEIDVITNIDDLKFLLRKFISMFSAVPDAFRDMVLVMFGVCLTSVVGFVANIILIRKVH